MKNILAILALAVIVSACTTQAQNRQPSAAAKKVAAASATQINFQPTVFATGPLAAAAEAKLSFKTGGIIAKVLVREGQKVRKGQLLAELRLDEIQAQQQQANLGEDQAAISLENARLALRLAERDYRNVSGLYADSVATLEQLENVEVQLNNAKNQLSAAEKGLAFRQQGVEVAQFNLRYSSIVAPSDGIILRQFAETNELVGPGNPVLLFGSRQEAQVLKVAVTDKDIIHLNLGDSATIHFDAYPEVAFLGFVRELAGTSDPFTGTYAVEIELAPQTRQLVNGFIGSVTIQTKQRQSLISIPVDGLLKADGAIGQVMVIDQGQARLREVNIQQLQQTQLLLRQGLEAGEMVITAGASYIEEGDRVEGF
ncbi:efflux RND transporter periplasmic adaptor subunit [Lewinella cohaerens]|uniref:efflux RND transporter periplasmic adaptor subunit n=1 Tax=Lewinella cohaerens TaxID=70995 RepID=UPI000361F7C1|nr:efflux RND transporter periplasmic adaptor subunit [Lewinella cohaerens]